MFFQFLIVANQELLPMKGHLVHFLTIFHFQTKYEKKYFKLKSVLFCEISLSK